MSMSEGRILITGSRDWSDRGAIEAELGEYPPNWVLVHGGARGADSIAGDVWWGPVEVHPADWNRHGRSAGFIRNAEMVALGADVCLAFIKNESRGATMCADLAEKKGIEVRRFLVNDSDNQ